MFGRDSRLPTQQALTPPSSLYLVDLEDYKSALVSNLSHAWQSAIANIQHVQLQQKTQYDHKAKETALHVCHCVLVYMPAEVKGKAWKLSRPYYGPYTVVSLTGYDAEVQFSSDPSIFVALDRVHPCPKEVDNNDNWSGHQKRQK